MAKSRGRARKTAIFSSVALVATGVTLAGAMQGVAQAQAPGIARHGMGLLRSPGAAPLPARHLRAFAVATPTLPAAADLSRYAEKVGDQGPVGSCAAWAIAYGMVGWFARSQGHAGAPFAPMYVYSQVNGGADRGTSPWNVLEVLRTQGVDTAAHYAVHHVSSTYDWSHRPSAAERSAAAANKITGWLTLYNTFVPPGQQGVNAVKQTLASGRPVALAIGVYTAFVNAAGPAGLVSSSQLGQFLGFHEVLAVGYDSRGVRIENSWGPYWGAKGYAILDWNYIANHSYEAETIAGLATTTNPGRPVVTAMSPATGSYRGGQVVTIKGSRLGSALITIGTQTGTQTVQPLTVSADGAQLTFRMPAGNVGTANVRVNTPSGISLAATKLSYALR